MCSRPWRKHFMKTCMECENRDCNVLFLLSIVTMSHRGILKSKVWSRPKANPTIRWKKIRRNCEACVCLFHKFLQSHAESKNKILEEHVTRRWIFCVHMCAAFFAVHRYVLLTECFFFWSCRFFWSGEHSTRCLQAPRETRLSTERTSRGTPKYNGVFQNQWNYFHCSINYLKLGGSIIEFSLKKRKKRK